MASASSGIKAAMTLPVSLQLKNRCCFKAEQNGNKMENIETDVNKRNNLNI